MSVITASIRQKSGKGRSARLGSIIAIRQKNHKRLTNINIAHPSIVKISLTHQTDCLTF